MHAICEIVIPPTDDVEESVRQVMESFKDEEGQAEWWDFYVIGGRFSGHKLESTLDEVRLQAFHAALTERKVTVSAFVAGKQELQPASQIPMVDELWRELFPGKGTVCPLFKHFNDQYGRNGINGGDICTVSEIPDRLSCVRLIVAGPHWDKSKPDEIKPKRMLVTEIWNRVEHQNTEFDGKVRPALAVITTEERNYKRVNVQPDWLVVTVDYHN